MFERPGTPSSTPPQNSAMPGAAPQGLGSQPAGGAPAGTTIYTMPEKFMGSGVASARPAGGSASKAPASGKRLIIIVGVVAVVLGALTAGAYYAINTGLLFGSDTPQDPGLVDQNANLPGVNDNTATENQNQPTNENQNDNAAAVDGSMTPAQRDEKRLADLIVIADALDQFYAQSNVYPTFLSQLPSSLLAEVPRDPATGEAYVYVATGDRQSYEIVFTIEESVAFKGETWNRGTYRLKPIDFQDGSGDAPVEPLPPTPPGSIDADTDGLTASEESLMQTSPQSADTDSDGYPDGSEVANFYSPLQSGAVRLNEAGLVRQFDNAALGISFYYPSAWQVDALEDAQEVLITTATGEYISMQRKDNPESKTSWEWYVDNVSGDHNPGSVNIVTIAGHEAVRTLDGLQAYVAVGTRVFVIQYQLGSVTTVNYPSLFTFILNRLVIN